MHVTSAAEGALRSATTASGAIAAEYSPGIDVDATAGSTFESDMAILGIYTQARTKLPNGLDTGERDAVVQTVAALLPAANRTVRVNIGWDSNGYQCDLANLTQRNEYKRIIARNAELGVRHMVFAPANTDLALRSTGTDNWGWESILWLSFGVGIRNGTWANANVPAAAIPNSTRDMLQYAKAQRVKLLAYVYPTLAFKPSAAAKSAPWLFPSGCSGRGCNADLSNPAFQQYLIGSLTQLYTQFDLGGFAWDYGIGDTIKCGRHCDTRQANPNATDYSIWKGWMTVVGGLRTAFPEIVMDHRVSSHSYGPWYQLAGSYAEPLSHDENPETYPIISPSTHTDHVSADTMRSVNYWYRNEVLIPSERVPGFAFHQTERGAPSAATTGVDLCGNGEGGLAGCYRRDFDLLGYKYSLLSEVATAGLNHVLCLLPARDPEEFELFPAEDVAFIQRWLNFSDDNMAALRRTVPLPGMATVAGGSVDGTAAFPVPPSCYGSADGADISTSVYSEGPEAQLGQEDADADAPGYIFLFNPGYLAKNASVLLDDRLSSYHPCQYGRTRTGDASRGGGGGGSRASYAVDADVVWLVEEVYPIPKASLAV